MPRLIAPGGHALDLQELPCRLGTSPELEFTVNEGLEVGPHQFTIRLEGPLYIIEHEGGTTETFLNDKPVTEDAILKNGDIIRAGQLRLEFSNPEQASNPFTSSVAGVPVSIENRSARRALAAHKFADALAAAVRRQRDSNKPGLNDHAITQALARVTQEKSKPEPQAVAEQSPPAPTKSVGGSAAESSQGRVSPTPLSASPQKNAISTSSPRKESSAPVTRPKSEKTVPKSPTRAPAAHPQPPASEPKAAPGSRNQVPSGELSPASASQPKPKPDPEPPETNENRGAPPKVIEQGSATSQTPAPMPVPPAVPTQNPSSLAKGEELPAAKLPQGLRPLEPRTQHAPTRHAPTRHAPTRQAPTRQAPTRQAPTRQAPTKEAPTKEAPTKEAPTKEAPTKETPTKETPTKETPTKPAPVFRLTNRQEKSMSPPSDEAAKPSGKGIPSTKPEKVKELPVGVTGTADRAKPVSGPGKADASFPAKANAEPGASALPREFRPQASPAIPGKAKPLSMPSLTASESNSTPPRSDQRDRSRPEAPSPQTPPRQAKAAGVPPQDRASATSDPHQAPNPSVPTPGAAPLAPRAPRRSEPLGDSRSAEPRRKSAPERPKENPFKTAASVPAAPRPMASRAVPAVSSGPRPVVQDVSSTPPAPIPSEVVTSQPAQTRSPHAVTKSLVHMETAPKMKAGVLDGLPWSRIAAAFIIAFAVAGALAAWKGRELLTLAQSTLGVEPAISHEPFLERLLAEDLDVLVTMDADACIDRYGRYALESGTMTIAELQEHFLSGIPSLSLRNLELLTYARHQGGDALVIASTSEDLKRGSLIDELGRGLATEESAGQHVVYTGYLGAELALKFAFLNDRTLLVGVPAAVDRYFEPPLTPGAESSNDLRLGDIAIEGEHLMRFYVSENQTKNLAESGVDTEALLRLTGLTANDLTALTLRGSIASEVEITMTFSFQSEASAQTFVNAPQPEIDRFASAITATSSGSDAVTHDVPLEVEMALVEKNVHMRIHGDFKDVIRRGSRISESLGTFAGIRSEIEGLFAPGESESTLTDVQLIAAEDFQAQQLALSLSELHASASQAGAPALRGVTDLDTIIENLHSGVKGDGIYQNYVFRLKVPSELRSRVGRFLTMKGSKLHYVQEGIDAANLSHHGGATEATE